MKVLLQLIITIQFLNLTEINKITKSTSNSYEIWKEKGLKQQSFAATKKLTKLKHKTTLMTRIE